MLNRLYIDANGVVHGRNPVTTTCQSYEDHVFKERPRIEAVVASFVMPEDRGWHSNEDEFDYFSD